MRQVFHTSHDADGLLLGCSKLDYDGSLTQRVKLVAQPSAVMLSRRGRAPRWMDDMLLREHFQLHFLRITTLMLFAVSDILKID